MEVHEGTAKQGETMRWRERVWGREELLGIPSEWEGGASPVTSEPFALPFLPRLLRARLAKGKGGTCKAPWSIVWILRGARVALIHTSSFSSWKLKP